MSSDSSSCEVEYEAERIDGKRIYMGILQYSIKWKDYPESSNTWEPLENLVACEEIIAEYEAAHPDDIPPNISNEPVKILDKRKINGHIEYLVRHSDGFEAWFVNRDNWLKNLIADFKREHEQRQSRKKRLNSKKKPNDAELMNIDDVVACILDMKREDDQIMYLVEYENYGKLWVPMNIMKRGHPQKVIEFYENCITWES